MTTNNTTIINQVLALESMDIPALNQLWHHVFHAKPPHYSKNYLISRLSARIQELAYGGIPVNVKKDLDNLVQQMKKGQAFAQKCKTNKLGVGVKLMRVYQGVSHEVLVAENGFIYQGQLYRSLSVIARHITGTQWNGWKFFGVKA